MALRHLNTSYHMDQEYLGPSRQLERQGLAGSKLDYTESLQQWVACDTFFD